MRQLLLVYFRQRELIQKRPPGLIGAEGVVYRDALPRIVTNGITAWLAAAGGKNRLKDQPLLPVVMGLKTLTDVVVTAELGREEWQENKALCAYCQMATLTPVASLLLAVPEALRGLRQMFKA